MEGKITKIPISSTSGRQYILNTNTKLFLPLEDDFDDITNNHIITVNGNASIENIEGPIANKAMLLDGNDWLTVPASTDWSFTSNFTIDFWVNWVSFSGTGFEMFLFCNNHEVGHITSYLTWSNTLYIYTSIEPSICGSFTPVVDTWYHIAFVRIGTTLSTYVNGTLKGSITNSSLGGNSQLGIGAYTNGTYPMNAYLSYYRITNGEALWSEAFTPPVASDYYTEIVSNNNFNSISNEVISISKYGEHIIL